MKAKSAHANEDCSCFRCSFLFRSKTHTKRCAEVKVAVLQEVPFKNGTKHQRNTSLDVIWKCYTTIQTKGLTEQDTQTAASCLNAACILRARKLSLRLDSP